VLAALGDPQRRFPSVLVAGSNGKGSTSALLAAMAGAAGYRVGHYSSPHLESVEERIRIGGRTLDRRRLAALLERVVGVAEAGGGDLPTYFEALTGAAFLAFAEEPVDLAVLEVGMGGRLDATNLADPLLSIITSISLEHREHLGDTLSAIAREKAGILRAGKPALAWVEVPEARAALAAAATEAGAELLLADAEVMIERAKRLGWVGQEARIATARGRYDLRLALLGEHQVRNLALAVLAAERLAGLGFPYLSSAAVTAGAAICRWPGRLEVVELPGGRHVLLDAAHNPEGVQALATFLDRQAEPFDLLFGVLGEKDVQEMLPPLAGRADKVFLTQPTSPRARAVGELAALLSGREGVVVEPHSAAGLDRALGGGAALLVACGSIVLVGEIRQLLRARFGAPPPAAEVATF
jgi:dihydrofolate synthase/folylpolyglutamate synthase